mgnify:CR=1 FL=1
MLFDEPTACYSYWFQLPAIAQTAGAVAVIQVPTYQSSHAYTLPRLLPPYLVPRAVTLLAAQSEHTLNLTAPPSASASGRATRRWTCSW